MVLKTKKQNTIFKNRDTLNRHFLTKSLVLSSGARNKEGSDDKNWDGYYPKK